MPLAASAQIMVLLGDDFEGSDLSYENLQGADLSGKNLKDATLTSTRLHRARLMSLPGAEIDWALDGANLQAQTGWK